MRSMIGDKMREVLKNKKISQTKASEMMGIEQARFNHWILNKRKPDYEQIAQFCKTFGTTPNYLMGFDEISEQDKALLAAVKSLAAPKETTNNTSDSAKQTTIPSSKEQER